MIVMVVNSGSSSLKYQLFDMKTGEVMVKGLCERIGLDGLLTQAVPGREPLKAELKMSDHQEALDAVLRFLTDETHGVLKDIREIEAVGHRIGHGGVYFSDSVLIDPRVKEAIRALFPLALLHNPPALSCVEACEALFGPKIPQAAVCDTAFHQTIPKYAYTYSLPKRLTEKYQIRRYAFHGTSHKYVSRAAADFLGLDYSAVNIIVCHLGNGSSLCAVQKGRSIDSSMGFTALEGLVMGTRCGDLDPALVPFIMQNENISAAEAEKILYKESGLLGLSGLSSDFRDISEAALAGHEEARNAIDVLAYQIKKYLGAYMAALGGVEVIAFTGGIGENSPLIREKSLSGLERLGIELDRAKNEAGRGAAALISVPDSPVKIVVMPTNEEWVIASDTQKLVEALESRPHPKATQL